MELNTKILIADENVEQRNFLKENLFRAGYRNVDIALNGEDAFLKISRNHPDVAIIDVWLTKLDGIGILRDARTLDFGKDMPTAFILVSAVPNQNLFIEATNLGAELCMMKPYNYSSMIEHIDAIAARRNKPRAALPTATVAPEPCGKNDLDLETQVTQIIHQIGVPAHIKGYQYLRTAILMTISDSEIINSVTKVYTPPWQRNTRPRPRVWNAPSVMPLRLHGIAATWTRSTPILATRFRTTAASRPIRNSLR